MLRKISLITITVLLGVSLVSCKSARKNDVTDVPGAGSEMNSGEANTMGDSDAGTAMGLQTIHFAYDSFAMDGQAKDAAKANAAVLKANASLKIQIEGHCDQRGGIQFNIALGEKRANAVKKLMQDNGIDGSRMATISYGKEHLLDPSMTEEAMAKNRRANFVVTGK